MKNNVLSKIVSMCFITLVVALPVASNAAPFGGERNLERVERMQMRLQMLDRYLEVVESVHSIADDPAKTVVFQLQQLEDLYKKQRNPQKIIALYQGVLKKTSNPTIRNAASMKLAQILKRMGRDDEAEKLTRDSLNENLKRLK